MDPDLITIFGFILVILSMVLPFAYIVSRRVQQHEERKLELELQIEQARKGQVTAQSENFQLMEDRLRVLERIVTDPGADLSRQIESLRELKIEREQVQ